MIADKQSITENHTMDIYHDDDDDDENTKTIISSSTHTTKNKNQPSMNDSFHH